MNKNAQRKLTLADILNHNYNKAVENFKLFYEKEELIESLIIEKGESLYIPSKTIKMPEIMIKKVREEKQRGSKSNRCVFAYSTEDKLFNAVFDLNEIVLTYEETTITIKDDQKEMSFDLTAEKNLSDAFAILIISFITDLIA